MNRRDGPRTEQPAEMTLKEAAEALGLSEENLAAMIREAGVQVVGPFADWRLEAADVYAIQAERGKREQQNLRELRRLDEALGEA